MKFSALIGCIGTICLLLASCLPTTSLPVTTQAAALNPAAFKATQTCDHNSSGADFVSAKVFFLNARFDPKNGAAPSQSDINGNVGPTDPYWNDLTTAFGEAPDFFKDQLCALDGVFIVQNTCAQSVCTPDDVLNYSSGWRAWQGGGNRYIATSAVLWGGGSSAPIFSDYQTTLIRALLQPLSPYAGVNLPLSFSVYPKSADSAATSVLAALAHEFGHVYWYDSFVVDPNSGAPSPGGPAIPSRFCSGGFYPSGDWPYPIDVPPGRWLSFGQIRNQAGGRSQALQLPGLLNRQHFSEAGDFLHNIYSNGRWASGLAAFSPDEEFVETFELFVLRNAHPPLQTLQIQIDKPSKRPPDPVPHPPKTSCFQQALCPTCSI